MPEADVRAQLEKEFEAALGGLSLDDHINPLLHMPGVNIHQDTPTPTNSQDCLPSSPSAHTYLSLPSPSPLTPLNPYDGHAHSYHAGQTLNMATKPQQVPHHTADTHQQYSPRRMGRPSATRTVTQLAREHEGQHTLESSLPHSQIHQWRQT